MSARPRVVSIGRRPRYSSRSIVRWVINIARQLAAKNDGRIDDVFSLGVALRAALDANPDLFDKDKFVRDCRKAWAKTNQEVLLGNPRGLFVPGEFVTLGQRKLVIMKNAKLPVDLLAWETVDDEATKNFLQGQARKSVYRRERLIEARDNPDAVYLKD